MEEFVEILRNAEIIVDLTLKLIENQGDKLEVDKKFEKFYTRSQQTSTYDLKSSFRITRNERQLLRELISTLPSGRVEKVKFTFLVKDKSITKLDFSLYYEEFTQDFNSEFALYFQSIKFSYLFNFRRWDKNSIIDELIINPSHNKKVFEISIESYTINKLTLSQNVNINPITINFDFLHNCTIKRFLIIHKHLSGVHILKNNTIHYIETNAKTIGLRSCKLGVATLKSLEHVNFSIEHCNIFYEKTILENNDYDSTQLINTIHLLMNNSNLKAFNREFNLYLHQANAKELPFKKKLFNIHNAYENWKLPSILLGVLIVINCIVLETIGNANGKAISYMLNPVKYFSEYIFSNLTYDIDTFDGFIFTAKFFGGIIYLGILYFFFCVSLAIKKKLGFKDKSSSDVN